MNIDNSELPSDLNSIDLKVSTQKVHTLDTFGTGINTIWIIYFQGESVTFRATTQTILTTLSQCLEIINQREDYLKKKMETEIERRRQSEELCK